MASRRSSKSRARGRKKVKTRAAWRDSLSEQLADHRIDAVAILLLVAGVLCLLGILTNLVGPVGHQLDEGSAYFLGHGKLLVPIALLTSAVLLLTEREDEEPTPKGLRLGLGILMVCAAIVGLFDVGRNRHHALKTAGGAAG